MPSIRKPQSRPNLATIQARVIRELEDSVRTKQDLIDGSSKTIAEGARLWVDVLAKGKKILFCGNGGSAADAQHIATELVVRLASTRKALPAIALTTDTSIITASGNDFGFKFIFSRQVEALGCAGDLLVCISTSGKSANVIEAAKVARKQRLKVMTLTGKDMSPVSKLAHAPIRVPSGDTQRIQEAHITILHILCAQSELILFPN
jgi:D-sedoheptulose 7-phosphate isomerase